MIYQRIWSCSFLDKPIFPVVVFFGLGVMNTALQPNSRKRFTVQGFRFRSGFSGWASKRSTRPRDYINLYITHYIHTCKETCKNDVLKGKNMFASISGLYDSKHNWLSPIGLAIVWLKLGIGVPVGL